MTGATRLELPGTAGALEVDGSGASSLTYRGTPDLTRRGTSGASTIQPA